MTIVIFIIILAVLILSHELGHFLAAKSAGVRVDEFGLGFPPALVKWGKGETKYSLNLIPFGGFVKIFGEDPDEAALAGPDKRRSLVHKSKWIQAWVLVAGVVFNLLLAWLLFTIGFAVGMPLSTGDAAGLTALGPSKILITSVVPDSPAARAGLKAGDEIVGLSAPNGSLVKLGVSEVQQFIASHAGQALQLQYHPPAAGMFAASDSKAPPMAQRAMLIPTVGSWSATPAIGIGLDEVVLAKASPLVALWRGLELTALLVKETARALGSLAVTALRGQSNLAAITGPVGLVGLVGDARSLGWIYLVSFTALISINLAVINLIPFPALDGGRLLFLIIEKIKGSPIKPKIANYANLAGFALLLTLMALVTVHDIWKLVG